ncbi:hypothetical protein A3K34_03930 [candidate division WWE3 bacterium RIFOXYC1_FULL_40_10]|nr:MAG: hypothetical protein A3K58_03930 [candidate division WWE3 bacterium RIFOXYB1_FULL_40_22]OGC61990.1 MAG: hypothetical protein A3K37_03930 [candidate division WWE3 bacterium RIFOXYA1_FULL_40_11]OGC65066.1 MAG: hypothetical protein A2326_03445 [candidate division WWE3 bacterium RIFOXYB2_FULL_41_6]OGC66373.1 MAG: hypothetical protein A3K34_03930 [candidate division WWE3 bacterium RIFOXYC1_FULL_40_10]OGC67974.1 MAG: hypothetical protein A2450_02120 [candidate division WWE3 bacterium RIFOXYC2
MDKNLVISIRTIFLTALMVVAGLIIYRLSAVFSTLLLALFISLAIESGIKYLMKMTFWNRPVSRGLAVLVSYALFVLVAAFILLVVLPPVLNQGRVLLLSLAQIIQEYQIPGASEITFTDLLPTTTSVSNGVVSITVFLFSNIFSVFSLLVLSIYMSLDWENLKRKLYDILPDKIEVEVRGAIEEIEISIGHWVKGEALLMFVVGLFSFLGLQILGVKFALALGIVAGLLEVVPMIGPVIAAILSAIIGFSVSNFQGIGVLALFTIIQQMENSFLVPKIMEKVSGFSPLAILVALLVGGELFGLLGAITAVPLMMILSIILKRVLQYQD